jgi:hypothetical protein
MESETHRLNGFEVLAAVHNWTACLYTELSPAQIEAACLHDETAHSRREEGGSPHFGSGGGFTATTRKSSPPGYM